MSSLPQTLHTPGALSPHLPSPPPVSQIGPVLEGFNAVGGKDDQQDQQTGLVVWTVGFTSATVFRTS